MPKLNEDLGAGLGTGEEMDLLVARVRSLTETQVHPSQHDAIADALRVVAKHVAAEYGKMRKERAELDAAISAAKMHRELSGVLDAMKPKRRKLFGLF